MVKQNIFRAYDIRGIYPDELNTDTARLIGKGFASYLKRSFFAKATKDDTFAPSVVVGRDNRTHGKELQEAFIDGLVSSGCHVTDIGLSPSPYLYFANVFGDFDGGCNVTASHNPKEYNGFKLMMADAHAVFGEEIQKIFVIIQSGEFSESKGSVAYANYTDDYFSKLKSVFSFTRALKVVVDTGNGVAGALYPLVIKKFGHDVIELFAELDGTFPNHQPDPVKEKNLEDLKKAVIQNNADLGLAFDGDGDRLGVVTEKGEFINSDKLLMLLAKDALSRNPGKAVVFTVSNSQVLFDLVKKWGGEPFMCKVGHSFVEHAMTENSAIIGGEQSGHFFLPEDYYQFDDALATACRTLKILSDSSKSFSQLFEEFPKTFQEPEIRPECADDVKFDVINKISEFFSSKYPCNTIDGVRIDFGNGGWAGIRASNTSPKISITMEALSADELLCIKDEVLAHLKGYEEISL